MLNEKITNHPCFLFLLNDVNCISPEISKRVILIQLDNRIKKETAAYHSKKVNSFYKNIKSNALYCEYLSRMFPAVEELFLKMQTHDEKDEKWIPDIFKISSDVLIRIMEDHEIPVPNELHSFSWFDYMGDIIVGEKAIHLIKEEYMYNPSVFKINSRKNELEIDFSAYNQKQKDEKLNILHDELPANVECKTVGSKAIIKLNLIKSYTGLSFQKKPFWKK